MDRHSLKDKFNSAIVISGARRRSPLPIRYFAAIGKKTLSPYRVPLGMISCCHRVVKRRILNKWRLIADFNAKPSWLRALHRPDDAASIGRSCRAGGLERACQSGCHDGPRAAVGPAV